MAQQLQPPAASLTSPTSANSLASPLFSYSDQAKTTSKQLKQPFLSSQVSEEKKNKENKS